MDYKVTSETEELDIRFEEIKIALRPGERVLDAGIIRITGSSATKHPKCYTKMPLISPTGEIDHETLIYFISLKKDGNFSKAFYPLVIHANISLIYQILAQEIAIQENVWVRPENSMMFTTTGDANPGFGIHYNSKVYTI
jgi:hypothetical protein